MSCTLREIEGHLKGPKRPTHHRSIMCSVSQTRELCFNQNLNFPRDFRHPDWLLDWYLMDHWLTSLTRSWRFQPCICRMSYMGWIRGQLWSLCEFCWRQGRHICPWTIRWCWFEKIQPRDFSTIWSAICRNLLVYVLTPPCETVKKNVKM